MFSDLYENKTITKSPLDDFKFKKDDSNMRWRIFIDRFCKEFYTQPEYVYKMNYIDALEYLRVWNTRE